MGAKTTESFVDSSIWSYTSVVSAFLPIKDIHTPQRELKIDYAMTKELSTLVRGLALRCGQMLTVSNTALITAKHVDFSAAKNAHFSRDADSYPLSGIDEVPSQQSLATG